MLTPMEILEQTACENGIRIYNFHLSNTKKSAFFQKGETKAVVLDRSLISSYAEERELLAEEVGHYMTGSLYPVEATYNTALARCNRRKCEMRAKRWAIRKTLPALQIKKALKSGARNDSEIADFCNVTTGFLHEALEYYKSKGIAF